MFKKMLLCGLIVGLMSISTYAEDMDVQIIGGPETEDAETVSLDDIKLNSEIEIDGYAIIKPTDFQTKDVLYCWKDYNGSDLSLFESGNEADYMLLRADFTNTATSPRNFLKDCSVKVVYDDKYEYAGWAYQYNYDNNVKEAYLECYRGDDYAYQIYYNNGDNEYNANSNDFVIPSDSSFPINQMYTGHYAFGCTLPNSVVSSKAPLRMEIEIDGNELTYNIRK